MNDFVINPLEVIDLTKLHFDCDANDPFVNNNISAYFTEQQVISQFSLIAKDELLLMHLNIRSLRKNFDKFSGLVNELKFESAIFGLSETWLNNVLVSLLGTWYNCFSLIMFHYFNVTLSDDVKFSKPSWIYSCVCLLYSDFF